jgi:hypothetical protein
MADWLGKTTPMRSQRAINNRITTAALYHFVIVAEESTQLVTNSFQFSLGDREQDTADYGIHIPVACTLITIGYACAAETTANLRVFLNGSASDFLLLVNGTHGMQTGEVQIPVNSYISIKTAAVTNGGSGIRLTLMFKATSIS